MGERTKSAAVVVAVGNQKGGVGKTTTTVHLAAALGLRGFRCLVVDLDPAAGATRHLGIPEQSFAGTLELLTGSDPLGDLTISEGLPPNVEFIAARPQLCELDRRLPTGTDPTGLLNTPLAEARERYDYVFLDTAPSAGAPTTLAAYGAAEWFLLTAFPHPLSLAGLGEACRDIADIRQRRNPRLEVVGVAFTNVDGRARRVRRDLEGLVETLLPGRRFRTSVSQSVIVPRMSGEGRTLFEHPRWSRLLPARQYRRLADELVHRVSHRDLFLDGRLGEPPWSEDDARVRTGDELLERSGRGGQRWPVS